MATDKPDDEKGTYRFIPKKGGFAEKLLKKLLPKPAPDAPPPTVDPDEENLMDFTPADIQRKRGWGALSRPSKYRTYDF